MVPARYTFRQLLVSPATFFDERPPAETLPIAAGLVGLYALALVGGILLVGSMLAGAIDATVTMDNPDRPPEGVCEQHADDPNSILGENCDEPETIERDAGALAREAVYDYLWVALVGPFVLWIVGGVVVYAAGRFTGGTPSFPGTLALAGWAALPEFLRLAAGLVGLRVALAGVTITEPERGVAVLEAAMAPVEPVLLTVSLVTAGWQWYLLTGGLTREADISREAAAIGVAVPLGMFTLLSIA